MRDGSVSCGKSFIQYYRKLHAIILKCEARLKFATQNENIAQCNCIQIETEGIMCVLYINVKYNVRIGFESVTVC